MNESLRIEQSDENSAWNVEYVLNLPTPAASGADGSGWVAVDPTETIVVDRRNLALAVEAAQAWAKDSGYKASAPKILDYGTVVVIRLRRP